jgi:hypothetical protein
LEEVESAREIRMASRRKWNWAEEWSKREQRKPNEEWSRSEQKNGVLKSGVVIVDGAEWRVGYEENGVLKSGGEWRMERGEEQEKNCGTSRRMEQNEEWSRSWEYNWVFYI